jgi:predicted lipoprotein with Yx(FWY)xxD motif
VELQIPTGMLERAREDGEPASARRAPRRRGLRRWLRCAAFTALVLAFLATAAFAATLALKLGSAANATLGEHVVVNPQGRTLYTLSPETSRHLLCKTSECFKFWPPLTVSSSHTKLQAAPGIAGHLGILRRSNGTLQVTLRGAPLYRYSNDHAKGEANGQGIESFGGTWHAATASSGEHAAAAPGPSPMSSPTPSEPTAPSYPSSAPATPSTSPVPPSTTTTSAPTPPPYSYPPY